MEERDRGHIQNTQEDKPTDIKVAEFSKKLDKIQIAAGAALMIFTPLVTLGAVFVVWNGAQHIATDKYIKWRSKNNQPASPQAA